MLRWIRAEDVFFAWRDGMLEQDRRVPARRMSWATLSQQDRELDAKIARRMNEILAVSAGVSMPRAEDRG
jgi:hypothetical protein